MRIYINKQNGIGIWVNCLKPVLLSSLPKNEYDAIFKSFTTSIQLKLNALSASQRVLSVEERLKRCQSMSSNIGGIEQRL